MEVPSQILAHVAAIVAAGLAVTYSVHTMLVSRDLSILSSVNYTAYRITAAMLEAARKAYRTKANTTLTIELNQPFEFEIVKTSEGGYILDISGFSAYIGGKQLTKMEFNLPNINSIQYRESAKGKCFIVTVTAIYYGDKNVVEVSASPG
jgi:ribosomal protein S1